VLHTFIRSRLGARNRAITTANGPSRSARGQSLVEFALVLPMLLVLLLGIADFGRVFSQGIILEAAVRNAAEAAAQELVQLERNKPLGLEDADYERLHDVAQKSLCEDARLLPERTLAVDGTCELPVIAVCVHDADQGDAAQCGADSGSPPAECTVMDRPWSAENEQTGSTDPLAYVEVRACYQFKTLIAPELNLPFGWSVRFGEVWLQRDRSFVAGNY
jgi:hypothetical protein